ncbi:MAG: calcium/sodium antiporter [bacterium]|nr:calcium/sodium antiporter [bacterium]
MPEFPLLIWIIIMLVGFYALIKGGDLTITHAINIAKKFNLSDAIIGLTLVAIGTSLPELIVNILAVFSGQTEIVFGNIIGSNITNSTLILGATAVVSPLIFTRNIIKNELVFCLGATIISTLLIISPRWTTLFGVEQGLSRLSASILLAILALIIWRTHKTHDTPPIENVIETPTHSLKSMFIFLIGLGGLMIGGKLVVMGATEIAAALHISEGLVGLTLVALGTSLPELTTCIIAVKKGAHGIAIGNILGSNIMNILFILGVSGLIKPIIFPINMTSDLRMMLLSIALVTTAIVTNKKSTLSRVSGYILIGIYIAYLISLGVS